MSYLSFVTSQQVETILLILINNLNLKKFTEQEKVAVCGRSFFVVYIFRCGLSSSHCLLHFNNYFSFAFVWVPFLLFRCLFLTVSWVGLSYVNAVFPGHTLLIFGRDST